MNPSELQNKCNHEDTKTRRRKQFFNAMRNIHLPLTRKRIIVLCG